MSGPDLKAKFLAGIGSPTPTGCMEWTKGRRGKGYGVLNVGSARVGAHRYAWELAHGPIPPGMLVCHRCDNPPCVNVEHLFLGTPFDNMRDMTAKGRGNIGPATAARLARPETWATGDRNGSRLHPERLARGERHGHAKLSAQQVMAIRAEYAAGGVFQHELARKFGVTQGLVSGIVRLARWAHVAAEAAP